MNFSSINIQGNIISSEILDKIRSEDKFKYQSPEAFGLSRSASLRDEIGMSWSIMRTHWQAYKKRLETLPKGDTGTSLTRERLIIPLLSELSYEVSRQKAQVVNGKSYAISHGATNKEQYPIHIMGYNDNLDKRRDSGGPRLSPHALVQEYLNNTEHLYALVTNGKQLRLLRDATRLVRMSYLEFDLERMFEEELYADFSLLFRVLHATRMPEKMAEGADSVIEYYHQESMASGTRIREKLSEAVESSIKTLANGFLENPRNTALVELFDKDTISSSQYYTHQLRLIYRILFLIVLEERKLIFPDNLTEEQQRLREVYYRYYSIERLRKLTENRVYVEADKYDLWESLKTTFLLFEYEEYGKHLGIKPLGSGLFAPNAIGVLKEQYLNNTNLIEVLKRLTTFVNEQNILVRVNYSDLDVEEFGSIYEGLLEYDPKVEKIGSQYQFSFIIGDGRSSSGSHYTPEELVKPLIKHSLDYIIADKLKVAVNVITSEAKQSLQEKQLLSITVCDVACGSGHILLSAARKIAIELASIREGAEQPSPTYYRAAIKDVIRNCIYGVDLNPLAVELCKVALWLEAHNPNEPLNFLDHHIKCGNAIVGLAHFEELQNGIATEAFKTLPGDDKDFAATLRKKNIAERKTKQISTFDTEKEDINLQSIHKEFITFVAMQENTPKEIAAKATAYKNLTKDKKWYRLKNLADLQVAQFFIPKTLENKEKLTTNEKYKTYLNSGAQIIDRGAASSMAVQKRFFHWFLEFPQVFSNGGFDCVLGNPPYLGNKKISGAYGDNFNNFIKTYYKNTNGSVDLVTYFLRRDFDLINKYGFVSILTTQSIKEGDTRRAGLGEILKRDNNIVHANTDIIWPGIAATIVDSFSITPNKLNSVWLNGKEVTTINTFLSEGEEEVEPITLINNKDKGFQGSVLSGSGFIIEDQDFETNNYDESIVVPYLIGDDITSNQNFTFSRRVINFNNISEEEARDFPKEYNIVRDKVFPIRQKVKRESYRKKWWLFAENARNMYRCIENLDRFLVAAKTSKHLFFLWQTNSNWVFDQSLTVIALESWNHFAVLQSSIHKVWSRKYSTSQGGTPRYNPSNSFQNFPLPKLKNNLEDISSNFYFNREILVFKTGLGFTKFYNQFHNKDLILSIEQLNPKAFEKRYSKETWNLYNHLDIKKEGNISYEEAVPLIFKLRELHKEMDEAVLEAYGWQDIQLRHNFYEVEYLPENDRVRYTIHPDARKEVLKRLLLLNHERFEEEVAKGLHKKKDVVAFYQQKGKEIPEGTIFSDSKKKTVRKKKVTKVEEPQAQYGLFTEVATEIKENSKVTIQKEDNTNFKYHITKNAVKGKFTGEYKQIASNSTLAEIMLGRKVNDGFSFGGVKYEIMEVE